MADAKQLAKEIFSFNMFDMYDEKDIILVLKAADDAYFNTKGDNLINDQEYDSLRTFAQKSFPHNGYFTGVGADVRGGKVDLPYPMGSLDQVHIGEIEDWVAKWSLDQTNVLVTDKLDGTSALVIYDANGNLQIAYSRGNGMQGADITRHVKNLVPESVSGAMVVRGEIIIPKASFVQAVKVAKKRDGSEYKNLRNMVAGLMNASKNPYGVYQHISFVAYEIVHSETPEDLSKMGMLELLQDEGFETPFAKMMSGGALHDDRLAEYLEERRQFTRYEIDGIVIDVNDTDERVKMNPTRDTLNPAYSIKYKVADAANLAQARVVQVHWAPSKHAYLKPRIEIEPVDLVGVTITFCTGFNAGFIANNNIGPGTVIEVTRSGDVIPFCQKVIQSTTAQMPEEDYAWVDGGTVDIQLTSYEDNEDVQVYRMVDFFSGIEAPLLKEGSVRKLYAAGYTTLESIITAEESELAHVLGANGMKAYDGLKTALDEIPLYKLIGAHSIERGIGVRRMKKLQQALSKDELLDASVAVIESQDGFDTTTAELVVAAIDRFKEFYENVDGYVTVASDDAMASGAMSGENFVFTGFRDKTLAAVAESMGGNQQSSVSGKTTLVVTTDPKSNTGKIKKARDLGIKIVSVADFRDMIGV